MRIVSWNMKLNGDQKLAWQMLREMDADIALLQEARKPPTGVSDWADLDPEPWRIAGHTDQWRTAIARLSDRVDVDWIPGKSIPEAGPRDFSVSRPGSIIAASVKRKNRAPLVAVSMYSVWERKARIASAKSKIMAVSSAHRMISDLSRLVGGNTQLVAAGDLNVWNIRGEPAPFKHLEGGARTIRRCLIGWRQSESVRGSARSRSWSATGVCEYSKGRQRGDVSTRWQSLRGNQGAAA